MGIQEIMCDQVCVDDLRNQIYSLTEQLNVYEPVLLSLTTVLVCIAVWLTVLTLTGKRRDKIRRLLSREQFVTEVEARGQEDTSSQDVDSVASSVNEMEVVGTETRKVRSGKISLPARMTDLYQSYPGDTEGMVIPETV